MLTYARSLVVSVARGRSELPNVVIAAPAVGAEPSRSNVPVIAPSKRALNKCLTLLRFIRVDTSAASISTIRRSYPDGAAGQTQLDDRSTAGAASQAGYASPVDLRARPRRRARASKWPQRHELPCPG